MLPQQKFENLLVELEGFVQEEQFAISQENWGYLDEVLKKKDGHLRAMEALRGEVELRPLESRLQNLGQKQNDAAAALQGKITEVKQAHAALEAVRGRANKVRELTRLPPNTGKGFSAQA